MNNDEPLRYHVIPWVTIGWGLIGLGLVAGSFVIPDADLGERLVGGGLGLLLAFVGVFALARRAATIRIADQIEYRRLSQSVDVPLAWAERVDVRRPTMITGASFWDLVVVIGGDEYRLPLAGHYYFGAHVQRRAQKVADRLQIPIVDPVGDEWRSSRRLPLRLLGAGHDWAIVVGGVVVALVVPLAVWLLVAWLAS